MVSGLVEGDLPASRKKPELQTSRLSYERVPTSTRARERQLRHLLEAERGVPLDDAEFIAAVFEVAIDAMARGGGEPKVENDTPIGKRRRSQVGRRWGRRSARPVPV
jgi:hypothetical protein